MLEKTASWLADNYSDFQLGIFFKKYKIDNLYIGATNKYNRTLSALRKIVDTEQADQIMKDVWENIGERLNWKMLNGRANKIDRQLISALRAEGYEILNGKIIPAPALQLMVESLGYLQTLLRHMKFYIAEGHLVQAVDNFQRGNWAACNAQLRSLLEEVFNVLCAKHLEDKKHLVGGAARKHLEQLGIISPNESAFIQSWFNILHTSGSHPGLSSQEDTRLRVYVTVSICHWAIVALNKSIEPVL